MNIAIILGFFVYMMYALNIHLIIKTLIDNGTFNRWSWVLFVLYGAAYIVSKQTDTSYLPSVIIGFAPTVLLYLTELSAHKREPLKTLYVMLIYLFFDGLTSPLLGMLLSNFAPEKHIKTISQGIYLIINLVFYYLFRRIMRDRAEEVKISIGLLPTKLYLLILSYIGILAVSSSFISVASKTELEYSSVIRNAKLMILGISIISVIIILFLVMNSISRFYYQETSVLLDKQLDLQLKYYEKIEQMANDTRKFRHDYNNHMTCLQSLLHENKAEEAMEYLESISNHPTMKLSSFKSGNPIADAILNEKASIAKSDNCHLYFKGMISERISAFDICTILANALDNSIEACRKIESDKEKEITVNCVLKNDMQIICISNPSQGADPSLRTTKENKENHGFGLYNIKKTVETLDGTVQITQTSPNFILDMMFKLPEPIAAESGK